MDNDNPREQWGVWCTVSGGVTGHREAWAKAEGRVLKWPTEAEAAKVAKNFQAISPDGGTARFTYTARRFEGGANG